MASVADFASYVIFGYVVIILAVATIISVYSLIVRSCHKSSSPESEGACNPSMSNDDGSNNDTSKNQSEDILPQPQANQEEGSMEMTSIPV